MDYAEPSADELRRVYERAKVIAVVGASSDPDKPAHAIPAYLQRQGYRIIPVNPGADEILGEPAAERLTEISEPIDVVDVFRPAEETPEIAEQAVAVGADVLWLQTGIANDEAAGTAREAGMTVVMDRCMGETHKELDLGPGPGEG